MPIGEACLAEAWSRLMLSIFRATLEYLGGERDDAPPLLAGRLGWAARCAMWALAILAICAFSGQTSKFIYIDF
jgi:hypothetical protein